MRANGDALSRARAQAILAATRDGGFDLAQIDAALLQRASMQGGPEFVALTMTPHRMNAPRARDAEAGV